MPPSRTPGVNARPMVESLSFLFLNGGDVAALMPEIPKIIDVVEEGLRAHGHGQVVLPPKRHIDLDDRYAGHFNILMGYVQPVDTAGVKVVGDYVNNYQR